HVPHCLVAATAVGLAACRAAPSSTPSPSPAPAAPACPAPALPGIEWVFVEDSAGFTLALPPGFQERPAGGPFRHWTLEADFQQSLTFGIIQGGLGLSGYRRAYQPTLMLDYSECSDTVSGYQISIQAWRTPNGVFRDYRRFDRYDVFALWEVRPGVHAYLLGGTYRRPTQDVMLAAIRSWRSSRR
ncbi:MAG TPA: hypothetical protein VJZ25_01855, partial [Gemmatimonadaceae bacterium]|nr:hypothetical protein [Gemmatimonadaceae bacterium]